MFRKTALLTLVVLAGLCVTSCRTRANNGPDGPIDGIKAGMSFREVADTLGWPNSRGRGAWTTSVRLEMKYTVWFYKGIGRVGFDSSEMTVVFSQADENEDGRNERYAP